MSESSSPPQVPAATASADVHAAPSTALSADTSPSRLAFGVGSFEFGLRQETPFTFRTQEFVDALTAGLQRLPTVNNVEVHRDDLNDAYEVTEDDLTLTPHGAAFFPSSFLRRVQFDLYIPFRLQDELARRNARDDTRTEHFRVHVRHCYEGPVVFVELLGRDAVRPATAVQVVREYLDRAIGESRGDIVLGWIGPSPFHADFYLEEEAARDPDSDTIFFDVECVQPPGYADLTFRYVKSDFAGNVEAREFLFDILEDELDVFYEIIRTSRTLDVAWGEIQELLTTVSEEQPGTRWWKKIGAARARGNNVARLHASLAQFETSQLIEWHRIGKAIRHTYEKDADTFLRSFLDAAMADRPVFPTQQTAALVSFLEERRSKAIELLVVLAASLVGGMAGSLITLLAS